jgi:hypothetical protein
MVPMVPFLVHVYLVPWYVQIPVTNTTLAQKPLEIEALGCNGETSGRCQHTCALTAPESGEQLPSQDDHPWNPQTRTTTETVLREAMQALVRVQAHMFARIVAEIRAADIAVELEPQL